MKLLRSCDRRGSPSKACQQARTSRASTCAAPSNAPARSPSAEHSSCLLCSRRKIVGALNRCAAPRELPSLRVLLRFCAAHLIATRLLARGTKHLCLLLSLIYGLLIQLLHGAVTDANRLQMAELSVQRLGCFAQPVNDATAQIGMQHLKTRRVVSLVRFKASVI